MFKWIMIQKDGTLIKGEGNQKMLAMAMKLLYEAGEGAFVQDFASRDDVVNFVEDEKEKENEK